MKKKQIQSSLLLVIAALIWGVAFTAQSVGMQYVGPLTFNSVRFLVGAAAVSPVVMLNWKKITAKERRWGITGGVICGIILFVSNSLQQLGIMETTVGKAGFLTALYIVIVPLIGLFYGRKATLNLWLSVLLALVGMYQLCMSEGMMISRGDIYLFCSAIGFSFHILAIDQASPKTSGVLLSCTQFLVAGLISGVGMLLWERPSLEAIYSARIAILYAGMMSCGVAHTLQVVGQKYLNPVIASLILSLEAVFSLLAGWLLLNQMLSWRELGGCVLVFIAIIMAQLPFKTKAPVLDLPAESILDGGK